MGLRQQRVISYTYMVRRHGRERPVKTVRFARVQQAGEENGQSLDSVGACFVDVDAEMRRESWSSSRLSASALAAAEEANKSKTLRFCPT